MAVSVSRSKAVAHLGIVLILTLPVGCSSGQPKQGKSLPQPVVDAWTQAGAEVGWVRLDSNGSFTFIPASATKPIGGGFHSGIPNGPVYPGPRGGDKAGDLAGFKIAQWREGAVARLPVPQQSFGIFLAVDVTDAGLKELAGLNTLQALAVVGGAQVTDAGLKQLTGLTKLQTLAFWSSTQMTDAGLKELSGLKGLQNLCLRDNKVTDAGLKELVGLKGLQTLDLHNTQVTDAGLKQLAALTGVQSLDLSETKVKDAGLKELASLKGLQKLDLQGTQVTDAGLQELRNALPKCEIRK